MSQFENKDYDYAWKMLNPDEKDSVSLQDMKEILKIFFPDIKNSEISWMFGKGPITLQKIKDIITKPITKLADFGLTRKQTEFDPYEDVIAKVLDQEGKGEISQRDFMKKLVKIDGIKKFDQLDKQILLQLSDVDQDGTVSYSDFKNMTNITAFQKVLRS
eukprot:TRINITY_DN15361_c0_g2_i4.p2 TRINITY_DN15361_c0_g2~~TRINITY_DN15361_c0_g2_i4.p2  ORF type:complete len:160 (-),score=24.43 TRINITY_DN15361_c0_g2_i4:147-626(-)